MRKRAVGQIAVHVLHLDAVLLLDLLADHLFDILKQRVVVHFLKHGFIARVIVRHHLFDVRAGHVLHLLINEFLNIVVLGYAHVLDIELGKLLIGRVGDILLCRLDLAVLGEGFIGIVKERQAVENVVLGILELRFYKLFFRRLFNDVLNERVSVAYRAGHHAGHCVLILTDDADDLYLKAVFIQSLESKLLVVDLDVFLLVLVVFILVGGIDIAEGTAANVLVGPAFLIGAEILLRHEGLHIIGQGGVRLEPEGVENKVGDLIVLIDDQHDLVVLLRPAAVEDIVLRLEQRAYDLAVLARQHLLPCVHCGIRGAEGVKVRAVIAAEGLPHRALQKLDNVGLDDVAVNVLGIEVHVEIVRILHGAYILRDILRVLKVFFEGLEVIGLCVGGDHGVHHFIHDGAGIHGVALVLVLLRFGLNAHHGGHHARHVHGLGLYGYGVA